MNSLHYVQFTAYEMLESLQTHWGYITIVIALCGRMLSFQSFITNGCIRDVMAYRVIHAKHVSHL